MNWVEISSLEEFNNILKNNERVLVFKHSSRCSISSVALNRIERTKNINTIYPTTVLIQVIHQRSVSNAISELTSVQHESPQLIVFNNSEVVQVLSHFEISPSNLLYTE